MDDIRVPRRRTAVTAAALSLAAVGVLATVAVATGGDPGADVVQAGDGVPPATASPALACVIPFAERPGRWGSGPAWREAMDRVEAEVKRRFGGPTKTDRDAAMAKGLIGRALDDSRQAVVFVVDPAKADLGALQDKLQAVAGDAATVVVQAGCHSSDELVEASQVITALGRSRSTRGAGIAWHLDVHTSVYKVELEDPQAAQALRERLGDRVVVSEELTLRNS